MARPRMTVLERADLERFAKDRCSFEEVASAKWWDRVASYVFRRYVLPPFVSLEDIKQEVLFEVWKRTQSFDPSRLDDLERYVSWNATAKAKKEVHKVRNAPRHRGEAWAKSRIEIAFSSLVGEGEDSEMAERKISGKLTVDASSVDGAVEKAEAARDLSRCANLGEVEEKHVSVALLAARGDVDLASVLLWEDSDARYACRLTNERAAERLLLRTTLEIATRLPRRRRKVEAAEEYFEAAE
jgi:hypothetical protein